MRKETIKISGIEMDVYSMNTIIAGTGAAGFNAADSLYSMGQKDIAIITEGVNMGTSRNTGSDKQTYYKLTLAGGAPDSVVEMAKTLYNGGCMHGDIALVEAALSARSFSKLASIGVPFPHNRFGEYIGYKTDHDPRQRATSAGPLTSRFMTEKLEEQVKQKGIRIFDGYLVIGILTGGKSSAAEKCANRDDSTAAEKCANSEDSTAAEKIANSEDSSAAEKIANSEDSAVVKQSVAGEKIAAGEKSAIGLVAINMHRLDEANKGFTLFNCTNIIYATGGPAGMYLTSVYPESQTGASGIAFEAGAGGINLTESQYGIASIKFRWNLSGTYQQVIPRYVSTDQDGGDEREFLNDFFCKPRHYARCNIPQRIPVAV